jgi:hypothetical protein
MNFNINTWKKINKKEKILIYIFISLSILLITLTLLYYFNPRIKYKYDSTTDSYTVEKAYGLSHSYTIPAKHNGKKVLKIGPKAFEGMKNLEYIYFEENSNLEIIDKRAFYDTSIISLNLPDSVKYVYEDAFAYCNKLLEVSTSSNSNYHDIAGSTFFKCENLKEVDIKNINSVGTWAFYNCKNLKKLYLNDLCTVYNDAFYNCSLTLYINNFKNLQQGYNNHANILIESY